MRVTLAIIAACVVIFIVQNIVPGFTEAFSLVPSLALSGAYWQFFTYMFLHGSLWHLTINMFILFMFGIMIENALGRKWYLIFFILSGLGSALFHMVLTGNSMILVLGASGAIFGILTAFAFMFPDMKLIIFPIFIPIKAIYAIIAIAAFELFLGIFDILPGLAHFGHFGGILTGILLMLYWKYIHKNRLRRRNEMRDFEFYWE